MPTEKEIEFRKWFNLLLKEDKNTNMSIGFDELCKLVFKWGDMENAYNNGYDKALQQDQERIDNILHYRVGRDSTNPDLISLKEILKDLQKLKGQSMTSSYDKKSNDMTKGEK